MLPVYRISEGANNLHVNYQTFEACKAIFREKGVVQIFSEGRCINEWHLRPLKKGTARLAFSTWESGIPLEILPVGINYSSYRRFGKKIFINLGNTLTLNDIDQTLPSGLKHQAFNNWLQAEFSKLVFEIDKHDYDTQKKVFDNKQPVLKKMILIIPAMIGWLLNISIYLPLKKIAHTYAGHNDHYDSVLLALLFILYPLYLLVWFLIFLWLDAWWLGLASLFILPLTGWAYIQVKPLLDKPIRKHHQQ